MDSIIDWTKYFDRIFCVYFLPNKTRMPRLKEELSRVGILQSPIFEWRFTTPCRYDKIIQDSFSNKKWITHVGCINGALEQLRVFKESFLLGYNRILIIEDDVAFLRDLGILSQMLDAIPSDYDVVQLDKGFGDAKKANEWHAIEQNRINKYFVDTSEHSFGFSTANIYNKTGVEKAIRVLESKPIAVDQINRQGGFKWATAVKNACIQVFFKTSNFNNDIGCHYVYTCAALDYAEYNLPIGYGKHSLYDPPIDDAVISPQKTSRKISTRSMGMWDVFDYVGVLCYTGYKDRAELMKQELARIGLLEKAHLHWDFPSKFREVLDRSVGKTKFCRKPGCFNMTVSHYAIVKTAFELGCRSVLVMEDDMRFLKDVSRIERALSLVPYDYDHLMLDTNKLTSTPLSEFINLRHADKQWIEFSDAGSTGCYAFSRRGMERYLSLIEQDILRNNVHNPDHYFHKSSHGMTYWDDSFKRYLSYPHVAVQSITGKFGRFSNLSTYWDNIGACGIKQEDYNLPCPVVTTSNFRTLLANKVAEGTFDKAEGRIYVPSPYLEIAKSEGLNGASVFDGYPYEYSVLVGEDSTDANIISLQTAYRDKGRLIILKADMLSHKSSSDGCRKPDCVKDVEMPVYRTRLRMRTVDDKTGHTFVSRGFIESKKSGIGMFF